MDFLKERCLPEFFEFNEKVFDWVKEAKEIAPELSDWIGIYYKASFILKEDSTDLVLGPYLGEATDHVRIPLNRGFCGMALREEKVVNVEDVTQGQTHIACSLTTRSELVIPLKNEKGEFVAELDIDSNKISAFTAEIEQRFRAYASTFSNMES